MPEPLISWQAPEFEYRRKTADWYWAMWIIAIAIAVISIMLSDVLLGILVIIGAFSISLFSKKRPQLIQYEITAGGVRIGNVLYPYDTLQSYNIEEAAGAGAPSKLLIKSRKIFMTLIVIPLAGVHPDDVHSALTNHLSKEVNLHAPLMQKIVEVLGF